MSLFETIAGGNLPLTCSPLSRTCARQEQEAQELHYPINERRPSTEARRADQTRTGSKRRGKRIQGGRASTNSFAAPFAPLTARSRLSRLASLHWARTGPRLCTVGPLPSPPPLLLTVSLSFLFSALSASPSLPFPFTFCFPPSLSWRALKSLHDDK